MEKVNPASRKKVKLLHQVHRVCRRRPLSLRTEQAYARWVRRYVYFHGLLKTRGALPRDEAVLKLLYLALKRISQRWTMPIKNWKAALKRFAVEFEGRMPLR